MLRSTHEHRVEVRLPKRLLAAMVLVAFFALSLSSYVALTRSLQYQTRDEGPNAGYAVELASGRLPTIDTPVTTDARRYPQVVEGLGTMADEPHRHIWTANHPPLYYLMSLPFVAASGVLDAPQVMVVGMRMINAVGSALCVLLVGLIAFEVTRRAATAFLATGISASCAVLVSAGGHIANDGVAVAASSLTMLATIRILNRGLSPKRLTLVALAGAAAAGAKAPGVLTVVLCGAAIALALLLEDHSRRGVIRALAVSAVATGVPALVTGWFYVRNIVLYGDPTATGALLEKFDRESNGTWWQVLTDGALWEDWYERLWVPVSAQGYVVVVDVLALVAVAGLIALVVRRMIAGPADQPSSAAGWLLLSVHAAVILANLVGFVAGGGNPNDRYLMPLMPLLATALAVGVLALVDLIPAGSGESRAQLMAAVTTFALGVYALLIFDWFVSSAVYAGRLPNSESRGAELVVAAGVACGVLAVCLAARPVRTYAAREPLPDQPAPHRQGAGGRARRARR
ncbi:phospholipid carrier-dependent glycosyltransferase [Nocardioides sp. NPDC047086]|uniref:phospholipid carrier-dependent glycosyltransferase n=1 Tax=Nocardioides sp. NPDC047086 TaxID=3154810 RepID=UPI0033C9BFB9